VLLPPPPSPAIRTVDNRARVFCLGASSPTSCPLPKRTTPLWYRKSKGSPSIASAKTRDFLGFFLLQPLPPWSKLGNVLASLAESHLGHPFIGDRAVPPPPPYRIPSTAPLHEGDQPLVFPFKGQSSLFRFSPANLTRLPLSSPLSPSAFPFHLSCKEFLLGRTFLFLVVLDFPLNLWLSLPLSPFPFFSSSPNVFPSL